MYFSATVLASCLLLALGDPLAFADRVVISDPIVRLGDVADVSALPPALRSRAADLSVADLGSKTVATVSQRRIAEYARRQIPGLGPWLDTEADRVVQIRVEARKEVTASLPQSAPTCARVTRAMASGDILSRPDLEPASCSGIERPAFRYDDRTGGLRASRAMAAGEIVSRPAAISLPMIATGQTVTVRASVGPVVVERDVTALQSARAGQRFFVRSADGQVFTATAPAEAIEGVTR